MLVHKLPQRTVGASEMKLSCGGGVHENLKLRVDHYVMLVRSTVVLHADKKKKNRGLNRLYLDQDTQPGQIRKIFESLTLIERLIRSCWRSSGILTEPGARSSSSSKLFQHSSRDRYFQHLFYVLFDWLLQVRGLRINNSSARTHSLF